METLKAPLAMSLKENRERLAESEIYVKERVKRDGSPYGNRHQRRLAAKRERQVLRRAKVLV